MNKAIVLLSGGLDSTTVLALVCHEQQYIPIALSFDYGSIHGRRELMSTVAVVRHYQVQHETLPLPPQLFLGGSSPLMGETPVPEDEYRWGGQATVPFRNGVLLAIAVARAEVHGATAVFIGTHTEPSGGYAYPDCSLTFVMRFAQAARRGSGVNDIIAPFGTHPKSYLVRWGAEHGVPFSLTYSCYKGGTIHCGVCATCRDRRRAFHDAGVPDPTFYERSE